MPNVGDELHHFGWNACSSALCPWAPHPHVERRYLLVPGLRSSRIHVVDAKDDPRQPKLVKVIEPDEIARKTGYCRPHTVHCGPDGIYVSALGAPDGDGPGGIFLLDHDDFSVKGAVGGRPRPAGAGLRLLVAPRLRHASSPASGARRTWSRTALIRELLLGGQYGHQLHVWDLDKRTHMQEIDLGPEHQMVLELRPAHDPTKAYGFVGVVVSTADLSASIWLWHRDGDGTVERREGDRRSRPSRPRPTSCRRPSSRSAPCRRWSPTSRSRVDDQLAATSPAGAPASSSASTSPTRSTRARPARCASAASSSARRTRRPAPLNGGPQMVEVSRDGKRVYLTNSLYADWDAQFYPEGIDGWMVKLDAEPDGALTLDPDFFVAVRGRAPAPGAPRGRRRLVRLVLLPESS